MNRILQILKKPDLRNKVLFILGILAVYRLVSNIPVPYVDQTQLQAFFANNQFYGLLSALTGGSLEQLSIAMLALGPYISASIIMQLLTMVFPQLEQMYKYEGEAGRQRFNQYSRMLTVPLALLQGFAFLAALQRIPDVARRIDFGEEHRQRRFDHDLRRHRGRISGRAPAGAVQIYLGSVLQLRLVCGAGRGGDRRRRLHLRGPEEHSDQLRAADPRQ